MKIFFALFFLFLPSILFGQNTIYVSNNVQGEIKPCGCSQDDSMGGVERLSSFFKDQRKTNAWFDLGNFSAEPSDQGKLKNSLIIKAYQSLSPNVVLPGPREFAMGVSFFRNHPLPYLVSNLKKNISGVKKRAFYYFQKLPVYSFLSPSFFNQGSHKSQYLNNIDVFLRSKKKIGILLFRGTIEELKKIESSTMFKIVIPANPYNDEEKQILSLKTKKYVYQYAPTKGQGLSLYHLKKDNVKKVEHLWLTKTYKDDPMLKPEFDHYDQQVKLLFFAQMGASNSKLTSRFKGASTCISCHIEEGKIWKNSKHGRAWSVLKKVNKNYDPECIKCHTLAYKKEGFISEKRTPDFINVQCENCHGIMKDNHMLKKTKRIPVKEDTCKQCHVGSHSPNFDFKKYWPKIIHHFK